ncbi:aldehyde dehydrogenase family protein [Alteromonas aestuariivivens]|uniref:Aldehyde dehydrogenase n=1 Tax=Alteromonas aestuariivivens TaxID=1938339 RepID=A0A3D8M9X3_9ALTE|nr:aldehyde dehydrogenase family protein [Alteromonas aestuariivivens]RDV26853.1 aldehyde dehydrogenase family protein [Alteromonas aestuariivivens]
MSSQPAMQAADAVKPFSELVSALKNSFSTGKTRPLDWRRAQLLALKRLVEDNQQEIQGALQADLGKSESEAWSTEIGYILADIKHTLKHLSGWMKPRKVSTPLVAQPATSFRLPEPLGTVLIIGAWNYPFQLVIAPFIAALAAGNCAVLKPSELSPHTSALIARLIHRYMDTSAVAVVEGGKEQTTDLLSLAWDHIFYTGGEQVGRIVMRSAAEHLTPVTLELGGKSPCIVDGNADIRATARRIVWGKWLNAGQTCIAPDYVLVTRQYADSLIEALRAELKAQYGEQPLSNSDYGSIVNPRHLQRLVGYLSDLDSVIGGEVDEAARKLAPTLVVDPPLDSALMQEEIFGPILPLITVDTLEQAVEFVNLRAKPLAMYLFTNNKAFEQKVLAQTSAGSVCINDTLMFMTNPSLPFGGVGCSGMGQYHGESGFATFSHFKSVMKRSFWLDVPIRYAPFSKLKLKLLKKLI